MRALCATLACVDEQAEAAGEPELAVLVVREGDGLPGQGWWTGCAHAHSYEGAWEGPEARSFIAALQERAFLHWRERA